MLQFDGGRSDEKTTKKRGRPRKHLWSVDDVAYFAKVPRATVFEWVKEGLRGVITGSVNRNGWRFDERDVRQFLLDRTARLTNGQQDSLKEAK